MEYTKEDIQFILECLDHSVKNNGWFEINCDNAEILQAEITRLQSLTQWVEYVDQPPTEDGFYLVEMIRLEYEQDRRNFANRFYHKGVGFLSEKDVIRWQPLPPEGVK